MNLKQGRENTLNKFGFQTNDEGRRSKEEPVLREVNVLYFPQSLFVCCVMSSKKTRGLGHQFLASSRPCQEGILESWKEISRKTSKFQRRKIRKGFANMNW